MLRHIVLLKWNPGVTPSQIAGAESDLRTLPSVIPQIASYSFGTDLGLGAPRWDFAIVADFASADDWRVYDQDAEHNRIRRERIAPMTTERASVQFEVN
jgi:hypothetical protein